MEGDRKTLFLCGGLQSSGSTLVSWCFLQRRDMNGILDADNDLLPCLDRARAGGFAWYKTTIACFRLTELMEHYRDLGWGVRPLLIVRDVRPVWASLLRKPYARNGITAEDPPLRLRLRRFKADWEAFRQAGWPLLRYESLIAEPQQTLKEACLRLGLPWDPAMLHWPKAPEQIADSRWGNETFWNTRGSTLAATLGRYAAQNRRRPMAAEDLDWLETEFREFNLASGYPLTGAWGADDRRVHASPSFEVTRRYEWETRRKPVRWLLSRLGFRNGPLIERRNVRKVA